MPAGPPQWTISSTAFPAADSRSATSASRAVAAAMRTAVEDTAPCVNVPDQVTSISGWFAAVVLALGTAAYTPARRLATVPAWVMRHRPPVVQSYDVGREGSLLVSNMPSRIPSVRE